jgi:hypothetical protein
MLQEKLQQAIAFHQKPMMSLLASLEGVSQLVTDGSPLPAFDYQVRY